MHWLRTADGRLWLPEPLRRSALLKLCRLCAVRYIASFAIHAAQLRDAPYRRQEGEREVAAYRIAQHSKAPTSLFLNAGKDLGLVVFLS